MNKKTLLKLEFDKITAMLEEHATSPKGKSMAKRLHPMTDIHAVRLAQEQTSAAYTRIIQKGRISFGDALPLEDSMKRLEIEASLSQSELLRIAKLLTNTARVKSYGRHDTKEELPDCLDPLFESLEPLTPLSSEIERCIISDDEVSDDASPGLRHVRRSIRTINGRIHQTMTSLMNGSLRTYLQDALITMRQDRYCLPVKAEYKSHVPGMIHDQSASGSTLFIEPMSVVKLNNDLKELYVKEQEEIDAVMRELSLQCIPHVPLIRHNYRTLTELDFIFAKGALAIDMKASKPEYNADRELLIREGRHPLLNAKSVVPITLSLGIDFNLLIVTGPNTGGKTVSLKTVGLFCLMGQSGLHIPAKDRSRLCMFRQIYADIGDEQSIEQSLSTFSSHMTNIVSFLDRADQDSLVLFDELGAGTDPTEGAALAVSILSHLHEKGVRTMATTHYSELKVFALSTPGVENASCEFDVESLRPTYRLLIGIPGKSNAFAISSKLGLPPYIIERAKEHMPKQEASFEDLLAQLEKNKRTIEEEKQEIEAYKKEISRLKEQTDLERLKLAEQKQKIIQEANEKAAVILRDAKETADETIKNFRRFAKENPVASDMEKERDKVRKKLKDVSNFSLSPLTLPLDRKKKQTAADFKPGVSVKVLSLNLTGTVTSAPDAKGMVHVQMGILNSQLPIKDLDIIEENRSRESGQTAASRTSSRTGKSKLRMSKSLTVSPEINLLGKTVDEAIYELDKYLDDAILSHLNSVRIVHGKGTGALRKGIHEFLRRQRHVKSFRLGEFGEGDAGVTIAELR